MELADLNVNKQYTYADYLLWQFQDRVELLKGKLIKMTPAPLRQHQEVLNTIDWYLTTYFRGKPCKVYPAPFDVRLPKHAGATKDNQVYTVVQPDICVVCDPAKLDRRGCLGAPDLVVEILSPGNSQVEMNQKYQVYQEAGVREYWLVNYIDQVVLVYVLNDQGVFIGLPPVTKAQPLVPAIFPEIKIDLDEVFTTD